MDQNEPTNPQEAMTNAELRSLLDAAKAGCEPSKTRLIELSRRYLLAIANRNIESGLRSKVAASDVVQETLFEAQRDLVKFRGDSEEELFGWLRRVLQNNLTDARRRFQTDKRRLDREQVMLSTEPSSARSAETASGIMARDEQASRVRNEVAKLPDDLRIVIELRNWQLKSFEEVGVEMNRSAEAARKLWGRAIKRLQQELGSGHESEAD